LSRSIYQIEEITDSRSIMFFTAKIHVVSGIFIGTFAIMAAKQVCKHRKAHM